MTLIRQLLYFLGRREKIQAAFLLLAMLVGACFEALGIGLIVPFIALISNPEAIHDYAVLRWLYEKLNLTSTREFLVWSGAALLAVFLIKNLYLGILLHLQYRFVFSRYAALARRLFDAYLRSPYTFHLQRNSAELLRNVNSDVLWTFNFVMLPAFVVAIESFVIVVIAGLLIYAEPVGALSALLILGGCGVLFLRFVRRRVGLLGKQQQGYHGQMIKWVNQGLGGIKEAKVLNREEFFVAAHHKNAFAFSRSYKEVRTLGELPRLFVEALAVAGMLTIILIMLARGQDMRALLPTLSLFAMSAIRLMPSLNRIALATTNIRHYATSVSVVYDDLRAVERDLQNASSSAAGATRGGALSFARAIELVNVSYAYPGAAGQALSQINLSIPKGHSVGFVGSSGAGKTTIVDVMLGLLKPTDGKILVDGVDIHDDLSAWQKKIGYIPQPIYLLDDSVRRNVAFGLADDAIDDEQVWDALAAARLDEFVRSLPERLDTAVGERGVRISGGQRQRIGIARALYHNPEILVLDEATSALDNETEREITRAISELSRAKTVITIAHRLSTVQNCDRLYFMNNGRVTAEGLYDELLVSSHEFQNMVRVIAPEEPEPSVV